MKRITKLHENAELMQAKKLRVAAYCRVSTAKDEQLESLDAQKEHYERYIKGNPEWDFVGVYFDAGISGTKKEKREGLLSLITDCEHGKVDFIITKSISRFARNVTDCLELVRKLLSLGISIYFEKESLDTGSMESELMLSILGSLAENESISISENEKWSIRKRFQNGIYVVSYPPYGYTNVDGGMVIVPEQAEIVKEIFVEILAGKGTNTIAVALNKRGVPSKKGGRWYAETVARLIGNEKYAGDALFQKTYTDSSFNRHINYGEQDMYLVKGHHEAIISHDDFEKANAVLEQRGKEKGIEKQSTKYQNRYTFSGRIKCADCGSSFKRRIRYQTKGTYVVWCCSKHIKNIKECSMEYITDDAVKKAFLTMMNKLVFGHQIILKPLLKSLQSMNDNDKFSEIQEIESGIEKNTEQRQVLTSLMASKYLEPVLFNKENNRLTTEMEMLRKEKESLMCSIGGDRTKAEELQKLIGFTAKGKMLTQFDDEVFLTYVGRIKVLSSTDIVFELKCGLQLKERLVD